MHKDETEVKRAVIYTRVSDTRGREDNLISFDMQEAHCRKLCDLQGWEVIEPVIRDPDRKGSTLNRPGLNEARRMLRDGEADVIVVWKLSRFARMAVKGLQAVMEIDEQGGAVASADPAEHRLNTSTAIGRGILGLLLSVHEEDLDRIRGTWRDATEHALRHGYWMSNAPLGYMKSKETRTLEPHPEHAPVVREMFELAASGASLYTLTKWLNGQGIKAAETGVIYLLENRAYLGEMHRKGHLPNLDAHEPIIDELLFRRANAARARRGKVTVEQSPASRTLAHGLVKCGGCRSTLQAADRKGRGVMYLCARTGNKGDCPSPAYVNAARLDALVEEQFIEWLLQQNLEAEDDQGHEDLRQLDNEIEQAEARLEEYQSDEVQQIAGTAWLPNVRERQRKIEALEAQREALLRALDIPTALGAVKSAENYYSRPLEERRALLTSGVDYVFVGPAVYAGRANASMKAIKARTEVIFHPEGAGIEMPRSGRSFTWKPFIFDRPLGD
jgi:DNA invertase Pin-like site-specific DNA recombinase